MEQVSVSPVREQLLDRRQRLEHEISRRGGQRSLGQLLEEVDEALRRLDTGTYGLCETCHDAIEADRLLADPLVRFCLDHLSPGEQRALERDLQLAANIQRGLLPPPVADVNGWRIAYHYRPARIVSGDYCDHIATPGGELYFMVGDVSGKGVAASMLMAHLHAMFRALVPAGLALDQLMERASRVFCESTLPMHYATLVCGRATADGAVEICNAGHPPPLVIRGSGIDRLDATAMPIGMFCSEHFGITRVQLAPGEAVLLCTDGVLEAENASGVDYGIDRLRTVLADGAALPPPDLVNACVHDLAAFVDGQPYADDVTVMALRRAVA
jgi:sigma-B regulation protein RsbU (phosphoserine phosphatase)